jgi:hypothetical protein
MQFYRRLEPALGVAASGNVTLTSRKVLGNVLERIDLDFTGSGSLTKAMISNLVVRLNGKVVIGPITATQLDLSNRYLTLVNDALRLSIDFTELVARSIQGQLMGAIDTDASAVTDVTVEFTITGATTPVVNAFALMRAPSSMSADRGFDPRTRSLIRALVPTTINFTAAGEFQNDLNYGSKGNSLIKRVFINSTVVTAFRVRRDSIELFGDAGAIVSALAGYGSLLNGRQPQAGLYVWDPLQDGNQPDSVPTRVLQPNGALREANFEWLHTVSGVGTAVDFADIYTRLADL